MLVAAAIPPPTGGIAEADRALETLIWRYLEGFGPASVVDMAQFALVRRSRVRHALDGLADRLEQFQGPDSTELFDVPDAPVPPADTPAPPRLMAMWDSVLLAHADRSRLIPPAYRKLVTRTNGDVLPTLLVDGYVAGVWRPVEGGIEATAFHQLSDEDWSSLSSEATTTCGLSPCSRLQRLCSLCALVDQASARLSSPSPRLAQWKIGALGRGLEYEPVGYAVSQTPATPPNSRMKTQI